MTSFALLAVAAALLAGANGANDNFKGVATLHGSGVLGYRAALTIATIATLAGSLTALWVGRGLLAAFSGKGLVPDAVAASPAFLLAVALGAGMTVLLATRLGLPVSTTHALTGALLGAGVVEAGSGVNVVKLGSGFLAPLLVSPLAAAVLSVGGLSLSRAGGRLFAIDRETCVCVGDEIVPIESPGAAAVAATAPAIVVDRRAACAARFHGSFLAVDVGRIVDRLHLLSAVAVSFARGLNDTPKVAALLVAAPLLYAESAIVLVAVAMALGGLLGARRVAETMSHRITAMERGEAFAGNLATAALVLAASGVALPVSTTHVSCGSLFGIGALSGRARWKTIGEILAAWVTTLPLGALLGAAAASFLAT